MENFRCAIQLFLDYFIFKNGQILSNYLRSEKFPWWCCIEKVFLKLLQN